MPALSQSKRQPTDDQPPARHQAQHVRNTSAERHASADLARTLLDHVRHYAMDLDSGKERGDGSEKAEKQ